MVNYIVKRILTGFLSLFVLVTVAFFLTRMMPGTPFAMANTSQKVQQAIEEEYGLTDPVLVQYKTYMINLIHGDFGLSLKEPGVKVKDVIRRAWPVTAFLGFTAVLLAAVLGSVLGIWQATTENRLFQGSVFLGTVIGSSIPNFAAAILLLLFFSVKLKWFPAAGILSPACYVLPTASLALYPTAVITRLMYRACTEEMQKDYVRMARAKGLSRKKIICGHVLRHALVPVINYLGPAAAFLVTGSFVVESVFTIPGLGREFVSAISGRDYTMILGLTVFMGVVVIGMNLVTDIICTWLEPGRRKDRDR